jgi:hypothetical protein
MMLQAEKIEQFVHRTNIAKYQRILDTYLTAEERSFVERRLAEERMAFQHLARSVAPISEPTYAA